MWFVAPLARRYGTGAPARGVTDNVLAIRAGFDRADAAALGIALDEGLAGAALDRAGAPSLAVAHDEIEGVAVARRIAVLRRRAEGSGNNKAGNAGGKHRRVSHRPHIGGDRGEIWP